MVIYIYGSDAFKKEIHSILNHSNIKFRLDEHGEIKDLETLDDLKDAIQDNPKNIYLIDDDKIIKKNSLNQKIKFLRPKDGIEQEYLLDNGIGDISVDSIDQLSKHIIKRLEALDLDNNSDEIQDSIVEIVEDAYENNEEDDYIQLDDELSALLSQEEKPKEEEPDISDEELLNSMEELKTKSVSGSSKEDIDDELTGLLSMEGDLPNDQIESSSSNNIDGLDDELNALLSIEDDFSNGEIEANSSNESLSGLDDELDALLSIGDEGSSEESIDQKDLSKLEDLSFDEDLANIIDTIDDTNSSTDELISQTDDEIDTKDISQGDSMADDFSEFDSLNEADILAALNEVGETSSVATPSPVKKEVTSTPATSSNENIDITGSNVNDIAELISKLLNNKTLEITVKVKD